MLNEPVGSVTYWFACVLHLALIAPVPADFSDASFNQLQDGYRHLQAAPDLSPWVVHDGDGCEVVEDGCVQTGGFPIRPANGSCEILARFSAYILGVMAFETAEGIDTLTVNGVAYSGTSLKQSLVFGSMRWKTNSFGASMGWKICPRSPCSTMACPDAYNPKPANQNIACAGLMCNVTADLDTCCQAKCAAPIGFTSAGYVLSSEGGCPGSATPYYSYYSELLCPVACAAPEEDLASGMSSPVLNCPAPGEYLLPTACVQPQDGTPQWSVTGACELYGPDCVQSAGFPGPYTSDCALQLPGDFEITTVAFDLEDGFDFLIVDGVVRATGRSVPDPFVLREGSQISLFVDADLSRRGFRMCARPLCSQVSCASGYIFLCSELDTACSSLYCEDRHQTCCRAATPGELLVMPNISSDAVTEGCLTTTTTTTSHTVPLGQIVGVATFQVQHLHINHVMHAWKLVLANLTDRPLEDVVLFAADEPAIVSLLSDWQIGYQVQRVVRVSDSSEDSGPDYLPFPVNYPLPTSILVLDEMFQERLSPISAGNHVTTLSQNQAMQRSGLNIFGPGPNPLCGDVPNWLDDRRFDCSVYETMCTIYGTSSYEAVSFEPGYYWYFYNSVTRSNPSDLDARQACCACGGGTCGDGSYQLVGAQPEFCAPCAAGQFSTWGSVQVATCTACIPGTFAPLPAGSPLCLEAPLGFSACCFGLPRPHKCQPGSFSGEFGQTACTDCSAGTISATFLSIMCIRCEEGRFAELDGLSACSDCPTGTFANTTGLSLCEDCPAGSTAGTGQLACTQCDAGRFNDAPRSDVCEACPLGSHSSMPGSTECERCDPGLYASSLGMEECQECPSGQQSDGSGATACEPCPAGQAKSLGSLLCSACSPGRYSARLGESECIPCAAGTFMNETEATTCAQCPPGRADEAIGLSECPACIPGQYMQSVGETGCLECSQGRFASRAAATSCDECAAGTVAAAEGLTACNQCSPGSHMPTQSGARCEDCEASTFAEAAGMSECHTCPLGGFSPASGLTACQDCDLGRYAGTTGSTECIRCESGRFTGVWKSTSCRECSAVLPGPPEHWTTMYPVNNSGDVIWLELTGAANASSCGCRPGTQPFGAAELNYVHGGSPSEGLSGRGRGCQLCGEGLNCLGMGKLRILEGYAWDFRLSVYDCAHSTPEACRGGIPGACAPGRDESKIACAECRSGWVPSSDGSCAECDGADHGVPIAALLVLLVMTFLLYMVYDKTGDRKRPSLTRLLVLISMGQLLTILQQLGTISSIRVQWGSPLSDILDFISALSFVDVDLLRPGCMMSMTPVGSYSLRVAAVYVALLLIVAAHLFSTYVQHRGRRSRKHWYILLCALGTIVMAMFVSIITTMLAPLQCKSHPNEKRTVSWFPSVICWEDDAHITMVAVGIVACTLPVVFLAACSWAAFVFPSELKRGSPRFLTGWAFLFFRFHAQAYWYGPVQLARNALISFSSVLHTAVLQTLFLQLVMQSSLVIVCNVMPWRAKFANYLEVILHYCFLSLVLCACFVADEEAVDELTVFGTILILAMPIGIFIFVGIGIYRLCQSRGKPFQFFLCHHKVGAGSFSRLLKMQLLKMRGVSRKVFVDTDDLQNLGQLFDIVDQDTECLVAIHSSHLLTRPWCVGEICTAYRARVHIQVVRLHAVRKPTNHFIENFDGFVPDSACLTENGIGKELVQQGLSHFQSLTAVHLPQELQEKSVVSLASCLVARTVASSSQTIVAEGGEAMPDQCMLIICDKMDLEAAATALVLKELITPIIAPKYEVAAHVLTHGKPLGKGVSKVALLCTSGLFDNPIIVNLLDLHDHYSSVNILPLMCSTTFVFPTPEVLQDSLVLRALPVERQETVMLLIQSIFTEIAVDFSPAALGATELVLAARANDVVNRLWSNMLPIQGRVTQSASTKRAKGNGTSHSGSGGHGNAKDSLLVPLAARNDADGIGPPVVDLPFHSEGSKATVWSEAL